MYEYKVHSVHIEPAKLESLESWINQYAAAGYRLIQLAPFSLYDLPGRTSSALAVFERPSATGRR